MIAAKCGALEVVHRLVACQACVNAADTGGTTALLAAAENKHTAVVRFLVAHAADMNHRDRFGHSALYFVLTEMRSEEVADFLLCQRADASVKDQDGCSVLAAAMELKAWGLAQRLLEQKAAPNGRTLLDETPLILAVRGGSVNVTRSLIQAKANIKAKDMEGDCALRCAVEVGSLELVQLLLDKRANVRAAYDGYRRPLLTTAIEKENMDIIRCLIEHTANVNAKCPFYGYSAIGTAVERGSLGIVRLLVEMRANTRARVDGLSLANFAREWDHREIRSYLLGVRSK